MDHALSNLEYFECQGHNSLNFDPIFKILVPKHISVSPALSQLSHTALDRRSLKYFGLFFSEPGPYLRADLGPKIITRILNCAATSKYFQNIHDVNDPISDLRLTRD